jgi:hypothetical protein
MVGADVRQVESEIDDRIRKMPVWNGKRDVLLRRLMTFWRDGLELVNMLAAHALMFHVEDGMESSLAREHIVATGVYQSLKWAMEYAGDEGSDEVPDKVLTELVIQVAAPYQMLVDALKLGGNDLVEFSVDHGSKTLMIYEGGNVSGHDAAIVQRDHITTAFHKQNPLVDDSDRLTGGWTAGEYRQFWRWLKPVVEAAETETIMTPAGPLAPMRDIMKRPVVVDIPSPPASLERVRQDLTLTIAKVRSPLKWKIDSWHDCPLVQIGDEVVGVSSAILTLAELDEYMLRVALLNDPNQYEKVSGLREARMIEVCRKAFSEAGWSFTPHYLLANPAREIDGYATRGSETCIVQLKSTLRPQSPW